MPRVEPIASEDNIGGEDDDEVIFLPPPTSPPAPPSPPAPASPPAPPSPQPAMKEVEESARSEPRIAVITRSPSHPRSPSQNNNLPDISPSQSPDSSVASSQPVEETVGSVELDSQRKFQSSSSQRKSSNVSIPSKQKMTASSRSRSETKERKVTKNQKGKDGGKKQ